MVNEVILIGNLGRDPEIRENFATFSVATTENYKDRDGEWQSKTEWHNCIGFGYTMKSIENLSKGDQVYVKGSIETTKKDNKYYTNIKARTVRKLGRKDQDGGGNYTAGDDTQDYNTGFDSGYGGTGDDVPF